MAGMGQEFFYYENIEGGHGGTANQEQLDANGTRVCVLHSHADANHLGQRA